MKNMGTKILILPSSILLVALLLFLSLCSVLAIQSPDQPLLPPLPFVPPSLIPPIPFIPSSSLPPPSLIPPIPFVPPFPPFPFVPMFPPFPPSPFAVSPEPPPPPSPLPPKAPVPIPAPPSEPPQTAPSPLPLEPSPAPMPKTRVEIATEVIQTFKKRIEHDPLGVRQTWTGRNACEYRGFRCAFLHKYYEPTVYSVQFNGFGLGGKNLGIDNFIENLPDISIFHANSNRFTGSIPESISSLPYLFELDLSNNNYEGEFPDVVLQAKQLTYLDLRFNSFSGQVPAQVFNLDLLALFINNNGFEMELPSTLWSTPVAFLTLANNGFSGSIPESIGQAADTLLEVLLLNNRLSGYLPYELWQLRKLRVLDVQGNYLTGRIPYSYACLENMQYLILARNLLFGPVPEVVCQLPKLTNLTLSDNYFTAVGPACMSLIEKHALDVSMNCISGQPNQRSNEECSQFYNDPRQFPMAQLYTPCEESASYLTREVSMDRPHPRPPLTYSTLAPSSN